MKSIEIVLKLKRYRDSVYNLFTVSDGNETAYNERIRMLQLILKSYVAKGHSELDAITVAVKNEEDERLQLQFFAAGYELLSGNDLTDFKRVPSKGAATVTPSGGESLHNS